MMQMRTHTCGELRLSDAGKSVKIVGWMENIREVGNNFAFVILRDFYGTTQVVAQGLSLALAAPSTAVTLLTYAVHDEVNWVMGVPMAIGGMMMARPGRYLEDKFGAIYGL